MAHKQIGIIHIASSQSEADENAQEILYDIIDMHNQTAFDGGEVIENSSCLIETKKAQSFINTTLEERNQEQEEVFQELKQKISNFDTFRDFDLDYSVSSKLYEAMIGEGLNTPLFNHDALGINHKDDLTNWISILKKDIRESVDMYIGISKIYLTLCDVHY